MDQCCLRGNRPTNSTVTKLLAFFYSKPLQQPCKKNKILSPKPLNFSYFRNSKISNELTQKKKKNCNTLTNSKSKLRKNLALFLVLVLTVEPRKTLPWVQVLIQLVYLAKPV